MKLYHLELVKFLEKSGMCRKQAHRLLLAVEFIDETNVTDFIAGLKVGDNLTLRRMYSSAGCIFGITYKVAQIKPFIFNKNGELASNGQLSLYSDKVHGTQKYEDYYFWPFNFDKV